nr:hypothetical protein [uncultured Methanospirillum sp.]
MSDSSHTARSITFQAISELRSEGYRTARVAGRSRLFDLIAWKGVEILFVVVRRTRSESITGYSDVVQDLSGCVQEKSVPGTVQFWLYRSNFWFRYLILPGGALPVRGRTA